MALARHLHVSTAVATACTCGVSIALSTAGGAIPPPPVPRGLIEASNSIGKITPILSGVWRAPDPTFAGGKAELRVGHFGASPGYLLVGRIVRIPQGNNGALGNVQINHLWALTYSSTCHGFEMISIDQLGKEAGPVGGCSSAFPITLSDGSATFQYVDGNNGQHVRVSVNNHTWREIREGAPRAGRELTFEKVGSSADWGTAPRI